MKKMNTINADTQQIIPHAPLVRRGGDLLPQGLHLLAGAPKIGKSRLALSICLCAAQGKSLWSFAIYPCEVSTSTWKTASSVSRACSLISRLRRCTSP